MVALAAAHSLVQFRLSLCKCQGFKYPTPEHPKRRRPREKPSARDMLRMRGLDWRKRTDEMRPIEAENGDIK